MRNNDIFDFKLSVKITKKGAKTQDYSQKSLLLPIFRKA